MNWRRAARCRDVDPELFFPVGSGASARTQTARAKQVCDRCPVITECLNWALGTRQDTGVWGGTGEEERRKLRRRHARIAARERLGGSSRTGLQRRYICPDTPD